MWTLFSRVLRVRRSVVTILFVSVFLVQVSSIHQPAAAQPSQPLEATAANCGDVVINEVLFDEDSIFGDEWVELYAVNSLPVGTELTVKDNDSGASDFAATFTLTETIVSDRYIVIHGEDEADSQEPTIGTLNIFEAGDGSGDLKNSDENIGLFIDGTACEELYWEESLGDNMAVFAAQNTVVFTGSNAIGNGESIARSPNGSGTTFIRGTTSGLYNAAAGQSIGRNNEDGTLAVTVAFFQAVRRGEMVHFTWQTAVETGTAGFYLLAGTGDESIQLNSTLVPSPVIDSVTPTEYHFVTSTPAERFSLYEISIDGSIREYGPYSLGIDYGAYVSESTLLVQPRSETQLYLPMTHR